MHLILLILMVEMIFGAPPNIVQVNYPKDNVQILRFENDVFEAGGYKFGFEQSDGTKHDQQGELKNEGQEDEHIVLKGSYSWIGPDGVTYVVNYVADDNGFITQLEQGPGGAIPEEVIRTIG